VLPPVPAGSVDGGGFKLRVDGGGLKLRVEGEYRCGRTGGASYSRAVQEGQVSPTADRKTRGHRLAAMGVDGMGDLVIQGWLS
jgi:hypothetical protein